ncbi:glutamate--cysteine ligase [Kitasatospora sp. NPDC056138]|uniref:carboxylate-amine ligase n=1 Tax=Kitasatospora sp. NPDC056138 TaxID=3345724 RepID=UPI0035D6397A
MSDSSEQTRGPAGPAVGEVPPAGRTPAPGGVPSVGVEEEYLLVDPGSREVRPCAAAVVKRAAVELGDQVSPELAQFQIEAKTLPCVGLDELHRQLRRMREVVAAAAEAEGVRAIATGSAVLGDAVPTQVSELPRYRAQLDTYRGLVSEHAICACQVHVCVPDREQALLTVNHLRPWMSVLVALMANSPFWAGRDTGYASWRRLMWDRWPVAGPPPYFSDLADHDRCLESLAVTGALLDQRAVYWDIRLSTRYPTLEIRVADMPVTAEESALLAGLVRALAVTALTAVEHGDPGPPVSAEQLRAACWRAARDGLSGSGIDPRSGRLVPAGQTVDSLLDHVRPALEELGDLPAVTEGLRRLAAAGTGAERQRAVHARRRSLTDVVDFLAAQTSNGTLD